MQENVPAVTQQVSSLAILPVLAVVVPALGALLVGLLGDTTKLRNAMVLIASTVTFAVVAAMYRPVVWGIEIAGHLYKGLEFDLARMFGFGMHFRVDTTALIFATITALVYLLSNIYAMSYMSHEHAQTRYYIFLLLTLAANLGVFMAADFFALFVFFELMAICSYVLVIHGEDYASMSAGSTYLFMSVIGGLVLLGGVVILSSFVGRADIAPMAHLIETKVPPSLVYVIAVMMIAGFGTKAGLFFLHIWLPEAHPVAPSPASALLSGLMVKVGVYGILRTANTLFAPAGGAEGGSQVQANIGYGLLIIAAITMFCGMANALMCDNAKELLAYSTISQIGYIVLGLGTAAYMGKEGAMGLGGTLYYVVNHAVFKAALFLAIGVVVYRVAELDINKLGGLWRKMPVTATVAGLAVLSIVGIPGTAGFASKTLVHDALKEAIEFSTKLSATGGKDPLLVVVELIFLLTAAGTFCYATKLFVNVFLGKLPRHLQDIEPEPWPMRIALGALGVIIVFLGFQPNLLLEKFIGPALSGFGFDPKSFGYHELFNVHTLRSIMPILYNPEGGGIITDLGVVHNFIGISLPLLLGGAYFITGYRFRVFELRTPELFSIKVWYQTIAGGFVHVIAVVGSVFDRLWNRLIEFLMVRIWIPRRTYRGAKPLRFQTWAADKLYGLSLAISALNAVLDRAVSRVLVDTWLSEPARVAGQHKMTFTDMAYWATDIDKLWDKAITAVMVDMWVSEPGETVTLGTPGLVHRPVGVAERRAARETAAKRRYGWINTGYELFDRLVSTVMVDAWLPESLAGEVNHEVTPPGEKTPEVIGPHAVAREEAAPAKPAPHGAPPGKGGLAESWQLMRDWAKGPGATVWRVILFIIGTAVLIVALLVGLGIVRA